jgi:epoxyqueuosine reductase
VAFTAIPGDRMTTLADAALTERVKRLGGELEFARVGVARAEPLGVEAERLRAWLDAGYHGTMDYMARTAGVRADPTHADMLASTRSVIVLVAPYTRGVEHGARAAGVARYALGRDYHNVLHRRLRRLASFLRAAGHEARAAVDSKPVLERAWAQRAGVGFIGKNCCLIVPGIGSHVFLSAVMTSAVLVADEPMRERCGECRACLDACPTRAFAAPRVLDARRCISYLTIEHRGAIDRALRPQMGEWLFGCDACQDACPFNRGSAPERAGSDFGTRSTLAELAPEQVLELDERRFTELAQGSPLRRPRREGLARNAAIVLGNRGDRRSLPLLRRVAAADPSAVVRDTAGWAVRRIEGEPDGQD